MHDTPGSHRWRQQVAYIVKATCGARRLGASVWYDGPVTVGMVFYLPVVDVTAVRAGDLDKLERNVLDALGCTDPDDARFYEDDVQVVRILSEKRSAADGASGPGLALTVWRYE